MSKEQVSDVLRNASKTGYGLSKFLDLNESSDFITYMRNPSYELSLYGGYEGAERKRALCFEKGLEINNELFEIVMLKASISKKFKDITHRHVLGTLMALGISRNVLGDIIVKDNEIIVFCIKDIAPYLIENVKYINNEPTVFNICNDVIDNKDEQKIITINVASMRLDSILARSMNLSREDAKELIIDGLVFVNHEETKNITKEIKINDCISVRKFGRIQILEDCGMTRKDRLILKIGVKH